MRQRAPVRLRQPPHALPARPSAARHALEAVGFTLIELILVMSILVVMVGVTAPALARFFRGRALDSEAKRFVALTRYGESRAVAEGTPMVLWIDSKLGEYGLKADSSYVDEDPKEREFRIHPDVRVQVEQSALAQRQASLWKGRPELGSNLPKIRFTPEGFLSESSPETIVFSQADQDRIWVAPNRNRSTYEIQTNPPPVLRR